MIEVAVFKVAGRMFALVSLAAPGSVHLNKRHWNTVTLDGSVPDEEVLELVDPATWCWPA